MSEGTGAGAARTREVLEGERERTLAAVRALERDREGIVESARLSAVDDEHDPEGATLGFERAHVEALLASARGRLDDLDRALERLAAGTYGVCTSCGGPVGAGRLEARPAAALCISCA
ncbi:TraR/DksA C4-type zinc finger protein [Actinomadura sp. WMMA1423]|uniref:TraR/DksA family transcriptional regulator n=1 Tax=Actinomadura sp. WMMA1423 TaxID=2591108 RepID=UPI00114676B4|nr:TraR/DksA C4-type zinc finger protein [Actinomadura sp. WMMA1423]